MNPVRQNIRIKLHEKIMTLKIFLGIYNLKFIIVSFLYCFFIYKKFHANIKKGNNYES